jgi:hypothetical protein
MNKPSNKKNQRMLPFVVEFVKFSAGFAAVIALALLTLRFVSVAGQVAAAIKF